MKMKGMLLHDTNALICQRGYMCITSLQVQENENMRD